MPIEVIGEKNNEGDTDFLEKFSLVTIDESKSPTRKYSPPPKNNNGWRNNNNTNKNKHWWGRGENTIAAAGILVCDKQDNEKGIWVLIEKSRRGSGIEYTDMGGKYDYNDCHPSVTIHREFGEEVFHTAEISVSEVRKLMSNETSIYLWPRGKYMCLIVNRKDLPCPIELNDANVREARKSALNNNPMTDSNMYRTEGIKFIPFSKLKEPEILNNISYRLMNILRFSFLRRKIIDIKVLDDKIANKARHITSLPNLRVQSKPFTYHYNSNSNRGGWRNRCKINQNYP